MKVLVTGAGGKTGQAIIKNLLGADAEVVVFVRRKRPFPPAITQVVGDLQSEADLKKALVNVDKVYHICPNMHPSEIEIGRLVVGLAQKAGVSHFVYHSVLHPQIEAMPHHWRKMRVEELLFASGLPFTILQPTAYMQNIQLEQVLETAVYQTPYPISTPISLVDLQDVVEVAVKVLLEDGHQGAIYELVGTRPLMQTAVAEEISFVFHEAIQAIEISLEEWQAVADEAGLPNETIQSLILMFSYYAKFGLIGNKIILTKLLNREPMTLRQYLERLNIN